MHFVETMKIGAALCAFFQYFKLIVILFYSDKHLMIEMNLHNLLVLFICFVL
jgi:hypothetical protein